MRTNTYTSALVTGGAGFIGTRLVPQLAKFCDSVTVFDSLHPQVHGENTREPRLPGATRFVRGDVRDRTALARVVLDATPDLIVHLAAETGTGQSYDEVTRYCDVNVSGTAHLVEAIRALPRSPSRRRIVLASSRAIYGEGAYLDRNRRLVVPEPRSSASMARGQFMPRDANGAPLTPVVTPESVAPAPGSIYASTKLMQEFILAQALDGMDIDLACLRLQNVYGPGQSIRNPYTGVLTIFCGQIAGGNRLNIFEDGDITRDFVHVSDVVGAIVAAAQAATPPQGPVNIGSGDGTTILDAARMLLKLLGRSPDRLRISGEFRAGDVRHAVADISKAARTLNWRPAIDIETGLSDLVNWINEAAPAVESVVD